VYNSGNLLEGHNLWFFWFQSLISEALDELKGGYSDRSGPMKTLLDSINMIVGDWACPQIEKYNEGQFAQYPGANISGGIF
jgi:hypothetical protein